MMGPSKGTSEYDDQVDAICTLFNNRQLSSKSLNHFLMSFILDTSYSRAAICEAEHKIRNSLKDEI